MVFGARPPLNVLVPGISKASVQNSQHFKKTNGRLENLNILQLQDARKTHFPTFSMIWATFCTHLNHCYLYVLFISQPQSTNFEQNLTRSLHFIGLTSKVSRRHLVRLECCAILQLTHWRNAGHAIRLEEGSSAERTTFCTVIRILQFRISEYFSTF